jgi:hypothetical protein
VPVSRGSASRWSVDQFAPSPRPQDARPTLPHSLAADVNHKAEVSIGSRLHQEMASSTTTVSAPLREVLPPSRTFPRRASRQVAVLGSHCLDPHLEKVVQLGGPQDGIAAFTGGDDRNFAAELLNQSHGPVVRLYAHLGDDTVAKECTRE